MALFHNSGRRSTPRQAMRLPILNWVWRCTAGEARKRKEEFRKATALDPRLTPPRSQGNKKMSSEKMGNGCPCRVRMVASKLKNLCAARQVQNPQELPWLLSRELPASNGFSSPSWKRTAATGAVSKESRWQTYSTAGLRADGSGTCKNQYRMCQGSILVLGNDE